MYSFHLSSNEKDHCYVTPVIPYEGCHYFRAHFSILKAYTIVVTIEKISP